MAKLKPTKKYYFTVEGETEQWYLQWLQQQINDSEASQYKVSQTGAGTSLTHGKTRCVTFYCCNHST